MTHVGERVRALRNEFKMTLPALADKTGLSKGLLSKLENFSDSNPSIETLHKLAKAFDLTLSDLLDTGKIQAVSRRLTERPQWIEILTNSLMKAGEQPDEDVIEALYTLQSRKGIAPKSDATWLSTYKSLKLSFEVKTK